MWANESERTREIALRALRAAREREAKSGGAGRGVGGSGPQGGAATATTTTRLTLEALNRLSLTSNASMDVLGANKFAGESSMCIHVQLSGFRACLPLETSV